MIFFTDVCSSFQSSFFFVLRDEGVVLKDLGSKWEPGDRSGKWLKLKPEYIRAGSDLDVLIIGLYSICCSFSLFKIGVLFIGSYWGFITSLPGGYYGSGRRGGEVAQFLVALADRAEANMYPRR